MNVEWKLKLYGALTGGRDLFMSKLKKKKCKNHKYKNWNFVVLLNFLFSSTFVTISCSLWKETTNERT